MPGILRGNIASRDEILAARAADRQAAEAGAGPGRPCEDKLASQPLQGGCAHQSWSSAVAPQQGPRASSPAGSAASSAFVQVHHQTADWPARVDDVPELHHSRGLLATAAVQAAFGSTIGPLEPPTQADPESDSPDSSAGAQPSALAGDPRRASRRRAYAWPAHKLGDDDKGEVMSPRSATSTVLSRTFSEPESQPQQRIARGVDRACSPICEAGPAVDPPATVDDCHYPRLGSLLGSQEDAALCAVASAAGAPAAHADAWQLHLEEVVDGVRSQPEDGCARASTSEWQPEGGQQVDLLGHEPHQKEKVVQPWRRAASPTRRMHGVVQSAKAEIPVKAPPHNRPLQCRIGSVPAPGADQGRPRAIAVEATDPGGDLTLSRPLQVQQPSQALSGAAEEASPVAQPKPAPRGRVRISVHPPATRAPPMEPAVDVLSVTIVRPPPIQTMLPLGWERIVPQQGDTTPYYADLSGGYPTRWCPPQLHQIAVVPPNWSEHRNIHGHQYWTRTGRQTGTPWATYLRPRLRETTALAEFNFRHSGPLDHQPSVPFPIEGVVMWGLATPATLAVLRCTQRAALLSQRWALRWFLLLLSERLVRWLPAQARTDLIRGMAEARRRRRNILSPHMDPPLVYLGDDGVDESRPVHRHAHPSRSELGEHRPDHYLPRSLRRISRALSRTRSPSRHGRTGRWPAQSRAASVAQGHAEPDPALRAAEAAASSSGQGVPAARR